MNLTPLEDLGPLPFAALGAGVLYQILGPTAKYLGTKGQELTQKGVENLERVFRNAHQKLTEDQLADGEVPPRVLRSVLNEGAFTEDAIAGGYLGGVLASSKVGSPRDDRGVVMNAMISRLSVYQLRLHYITYMAAHNLFRGIDSGFKEEHEFENCIFFGMTGLLAAMGFNATEYEDPEFDTHAAMTHALYGLSKEELITSWKMDWDTGLEYCPTPIGTELFLWANGKGRKHLEYFFNKDFTPYIVDNEEAPIMLAGREVLVESPSGETLTVHGYDYTYQVRRSCPIKSQTL